MDTFALSLIWQFYLILHWIVISWGHHSGISFPVKKYKSLPVVQDFEKSGQIICSLAGSRSVRKHGFCGRLILKTWPATVYGLLLDDWTTHERLIDGQWSEKTQKKYHLTVIEGPAKSIFQAEKVAVGKSICKLTLPFTSQKHHRPHYLDFLFDSSFSSHPRQFFLWVKTNWKTFQAVVNLMLKVNFQWVHWLCFHGLFTRLRESRSQQRRRLCDKIVLLHHICPTLEGVVEGQLLVEFSNFTCQRFSITFALGHLWVTDSNADHLLTTLGIREHIFFTNCALMDQFWREGDSGVRRACFLRNERGRGTGR